MRRLYGAPAHHLVLHLALFAVIVWVVGKVADIRAAGNVLVWFVAALVLHDLVLVPLYSSLDQVAQNLDGWRRPARVPIVNHLRVPAILGALLFLGFPGLILGKSDGNLHYVSGITPSGYLLRWALICAALLLGSALLWVARIKKFEHAADPARDEHTTGW